MPHLPKGLNLASDGRLRAGWGVKLPDLVASSIDPATGKANFPFSAWAHDYSKPTSFLVVGADPGLWMGNPRADYQRPPSEYDAQLPATIMRDGREIPRPAWLTVGLLPFWKAPAGQEDYADPIYVDVPAWNGERRVTARARGEPVWLPAIPTLDSWMPFRWWTENGIAALLEGLDASARYERHRRGHDVRAAGAALAPLEYTADGLPVLDRRAGVVVVPHIPTLGAAEIAKVDFDQRYSGPAPAALRGNDGLRGCPETHVLWRLDFEERPEDGGEAKPSSGGNAARWRDPWAEET